LATGSVFAQTIGPIQPVCPVAIQPVSTGVTARPAVNYSDNATRLDSMWMHSRENLQGYVTKEKFAPCLFYNPVEDDLSDQLGGFQSALVVNNPSPSLSANVQVELRNRNGNLVTTLFTTISPNGTWTRGVPELLALARGVGSARIVSDQPVVGSSLHYLDSVVIGGTRLSDPDILAPGEGTMQQLQAPQRAGMNLYAGPMPLSNSSGFDFLNGNLPFYCVMNTTTTQTRIRAYKGTGGGITFPTINTVLPGYGNFIDLTVWQAIEPLYSAGASTFDDNGWAYVSSETSPLVGDLYLADFFGDDSSIDPSMQKGTKFRVGSAIMANSPAVSLTGAEVTQQITVPLPRTDTMIGVLNASVVDAGPVRVTYRNRNGMVVGTNTVASLPPGQSLRLTPGTPGFPAAPTFHGWVEINACNASLVGWNMHEITRNGNNHFEKAYGEALVGANAREPGGSISVVQQGIPVNRKVASLARVSPWWWPSYHNFANNSVGNVGNYWFRFYGLAGNDVTNYANQPYAGLPFGSTSFTYQDGLNPQVNVFFDQNVSGRVDVTNGSVIGVSAIGDPMREWGIPFYPNGTAPGLLKRR
jgi:hypothetical protein